MVAAVFSTADAAVVASFIAAVGASVNTVLSLRTRRDAKQINRSVNHVGPDEPTLIQRVRRMERETAAHRRWEAETFDRIATQIGVEISAPPDAHDQEDTNP